MVCEFIQKSYWGQGRTQDQILKSFENSICFGAFKDGRHVGFSRVVSDRVFFAYIFDLFVVEEFRGQGIAKALTQAILDHDQLREVSGFMLSTREAHGLYEPFGFKVMADSSRLMVRGKAKE